MTTTAWRFIATEGADEAVLKLKQLQTAKLVEVARYHCYPLGPLRSPGAGAG